MRKLPLIKLAKQPADTPRPALPISVAMPIVAFIGVLITLVTGMLYAASTAYGNAYFRTLGVDPALFTSTWHGSVYAGTISAMPAFAALAIPLLLVGAAFWLAGSFGSSLKSLILLIPDGWWRRLFLSEIGAEREWSWAEKVGAVFILFSVTPAAAYYLYVKYVGVAENFGADQARRVIAAVKLNDVRAMKELRLVRVSLTRTEGGNNHVLETGIQIGCQTDTVCALRLPEKTVVVPFKQVLRIDAVNIE